MRIKRSELNIAVVLRMMGWLLMIEAFFMLFPIVCGVVYEERDAVMSFVWSAVITAGVGALMTFGIRPSRTEMGRREGLLLTAVVWVFFSFFGMLPFLFGGVLTTVTDAFYEAVAGFTTTGSTMITDLEVVSHPALLWRSIMQWLGGMGIILFTLAVIPMLNHSGGIQLFNAEVTGITHDKLRPRISSTAKTLWMVYLAMSVILCVLLKLGPMNWFDSICHTLSTVSTGGFSTHNESIAWWDSAYVESVIAAFMFFGGINIALIYRFFTGKFRALVGNGTFQWYFWIIVMFSVLCGVSMLALGTFTGWLDVVFSVLTAITSTGFSVGDFETYGNFAIIVTLILIFFGGCAGSTAGGAKIDRIEFLMKNSRNEIYRILHPNSIITLRVNSKAIPVPVVMKVIAFLGIYVLLMVTGAVAMSWFDVPALDALFASTSMLSNSGLGVGEMGASGSYAALPTGVKWIQAALMLIGRLELFTVLVLFTPGFWKK